MSANDEKKTQSGAVPPKTPEKRAQEAEEAEKSGADPTGSAAKYVFKILPADPKNAFDFEDVADK